MGKPAPLLVDEIRNEIKSCTTTTQQTLNLLRAILCPLDDRQLSCVSKPTVKSRQHNALPTRGKSEVKRIRKGSNNERPTFEIHEEQDKTLSADAQRRFATEVFNTTIKSLTSTTKFLPASGEACSQKDSPGKEQQSGKSLQHHSPNLRDTNLKSTADCANTAINFLRQSLSAQADAEDEKAVGLEKGALALLDKEISLKLMKQAFHQISKIHEQYWKRQKGGVLKISGNAFEDNIISSLFCLSPIANEAWSNVGMSIQFHALRLALLLGPSSVTQELIRALRVDHIGGPLTLVTEGLKLRVVNENAAGKHLLNISLAILKLYSICQNGKLPPEVGASHLFDFVSTALLIRISGWQYLGHVPDLAKDLWDIFMKAARKFTSSTKPDVFEVTFLYQRLHDVKDALGSAGFKSALPGDLKHLVARLDKKTRVPSSLIKILEADEGADKASPSQSQLLVSWKAALAKLQDFSADAAGCLLTCEDMLRAWKASPNPTLQQMDELLVTGAQLRKSAGNILRSIEQQKKENRCEQYIRSLQAITLEIVYEFMGFLSFYVNNSEFTTSPMLQNRRKALLTTSARSIQEVIAAQKCAITKSTELWNVNDLALSRCVSISNILLRDIQFSGDERELCVFFRDLPIQISNIYWHQFQDARQKQLPGALSIQCLEKSVAVLANSSDDDQKAAFICLKYETLSDRYTEIKDYQNAVLLAKSAIDFSIKQGDLSDLIELALYDCCEDVWNDADLRAFTVNKNLQRLAKINLKQGASDLSDTSYYDNNALPEIHRFVLLERQIHQRKDDCSTETGKSSYINAVKLALELCRLPMYTGCRLRLTSFLLASSAWCENLIASNIINDQIVKRLTDTSFTDQHTVPQDSLDALSAIVSSQWAFQNGQMNQEKLELSVSRLVKVIEASTSMEVLKRVFSDIGICLSQLQALADYAGVLSCIEIRISALRLMEYIFRLQESLSTERATLCILQIASCYNMVQKSADASNELRKAQKLLTNIRANSFTHLEFALINGDNLLSLSDFPNCAQAIVMANKILQKISEDAIPCPDRSRGQFERYLSHASYLASRLAFNQGDLEAATIYARRSVKLSTSIWIAIEKLLKEEYTQSLQEENGHSFEVKKTSMSLTAKDRSLPSKWAIQGARYWFHISMHCKALVHMGSISAHHGLYQDASYYFEEAAKVAEAVCSSPLSMKIRTEKALLNARAGRREYAEELLSETQEISQWSSLGFCSVEAAVNIGEVLILLNEAQSAHHHLDKVLPYFRHVTEAQQPLQSTESENTKVSRSTANSHLRHQKPKMALTNTNLSEVHHSSTQTSPAKLSLDQKILNDRVDTLCERIKTARLRAGQPIQTRKPENILDLSSWSPERSVARGIQMMEAVLEMLSNDAVNSILTETALAVPVRYNTRGPNGRTSFTGSESPAELRRKHAKSASSPNARSLAPNRTLQNAFELMDYSHSLLSKVQSSRSNQIPSEMVHILHKTLAQLALLSATLSRPCDSSSLQLVLQLLMPKDLARNREQMSIRAERASLDRDHTHLWPNLDSKEMAYSTVTNIYRGCSQAIDLLPETWSVISISLSQDQNELLVSKIVAKRSPFLVRIPIVRSGVDDESEHDFTFEACKSELLDIVKQANATAHDVRGQGDKDTRKTWYSEREALDRQLEILLDNIENIWLGGFRGLLATEKADEASISRFGQSLSQTLDKHLPSRQKVASGSQKRVVLHVHVIELFTSINISQGADVENSVMDLLYFVVDILQFNGEQNAYDEIDFDDILVDILDALKSYHDSIASKQAQHLAQHVILILDKELQCFPWESLPCLKGRSVSRMPSLIALWERLEMMQTQQSGSQHYSIPSNSGLYMLNPSSDLSSTQDTFGPVFESQLENFGNFIGRAPSEQEFESCLRENDLFLYFGHGSGAQYIRGRTIRKLDQCAVTLLMGCSSSRLTECGVYEPYGMPWHYMHAKSPAVVGTLWDVTDRDIDRFAMRAMCEWGLLREDENTEKLFSKQQGKGKGKTKAKSGPVKSSKDLGDWNEQAKRGVITLNEAVAKARDSCMLKYLNGAAPVIYGVPVMLK